MENYISKRLSNRIKLFTFSTYICMINQIINQPRWLYKYPIENKLYFVDIFSQKIKLYYKDGISRYADWYLLYLYDIRYWACQPLDLVLLITRRIFLTSTELGVGSKLTSSINEDIISTSNI